MQKTKLPPKLPQDANLDITGGASFSIGLTGQRAWSADANSAQIRNEKNRQVLKLTKLTCHMYKQGEDVLQVSADTGTMVRTGEILRMELRGQIRATEKKNHQHLQADSFRWISTEEIIHVTNFTWTRDGAMAHAASGTVTTDFSEIKTTSPIRVELTDPAPRR